MRSRDDLLGILNDPAKQRPPAKSTPMAAVDLALVSAATAQLDLDQARDFGSETTLAP